MRECRAAAERLSPVLREIAQTVGHGLIKTEYGTGYVCEILLLFCKFGITFLQKEKIPRMMLKNTVSVFILALVLLCSVAALSGCGDAATRSTLDRADSLMEAHPDSALSLLDGIDRNALVTRADRARHSLLLSMALDKNYVDTTTFDILQPAIDYYADHGSADERLRTLYYQGRIYQNRGDLDCAMSCFVRATDDTCGLSDSLTLIRAFVAQGSISYQLYDFESYII